MILCCKPLIPSEEHEHGITEKCGLVLSLNIIAAVSFKIEPRCKKTGLRGFRPGPTQTGLYSYRRCLGA